MIVKYKKKREGPNVTNVTEISHICGTQPHEIGTVLQFFHF
jgi:hypothetical protein